MAANLYMKLGSGKDQLRGRTGDNFHVGWIKLVSIAFAADVQDPRSPGGAPHGQVFQFTLVYDPTVSPHLSRATITGRGFSSLITEATDADTGVPTIRLELQNVWLRSFVASYNDTVVETYDTKFDRLTVNNNPVPFVAAKTVVRSLAQQLFPNK